MTLSQIKQKIYFLSKSNSSSFDATDMLVAINNAYERVTSLILHADGRWQYDDSNRDDFPVATANLVSGQNDYTLAAAHVRIVHVEVKDENGNWHKLSPVDRADSGYSPSEEEEETGTPVEYDKIGASLILKPKPNYNSTNGLKVHYQRGPELFTSDDLTTGSAEPGFNSLYHDLIALWPAYEYACANGMQHANQLMDEILRKENQLKLDYAKRDKDERTSMTFKRISYL